MASKKASIFLHQGKFENFIKNFFFKKEFAIKSYIVKRIIKFFYLFINGGPIMIRVDKLRTSSNVGSKKTFASVGYRTNGNINDELSSGEIDNGISNGKRNDEKIIDSFGDGFCSTIGGSSIDSDCDRVDDDIGGNNDNRGNVNDKDGEGKR